MKSSTSGFSAVLILVFVLVIVAVGMAYYFGTQKASVPSISPSYSPVSDPTANWKTYLNSELKFSFKYPPSLQELTYKNVPIVDFKNENDKLVLRAERRYDFNNELQKINKLADGGSIDNVFTEGETTKLSSEKAGAKLLIYYEYLPSDSGMAGFGYKYGVIVGEGENFSEISTYGETKSQVEGFKSSFDQIVSTFKFLD